MQPVLNEDEFIPEEHMLKEDIQKNSYISEIMTYKIIAQYIIDNLRAYYKIPNDEIIRVYVKSSNKSSDELLFTSNKCDRNEEVAINDEVVFEILNFVFIIFKILDKKGFFNRKSVKFHMNKNVLMKKYDKKAIRVFGAILCILNIIPIWL